MQHDSHAKGFGLVGLLVIIVVLMAISGAGVYVYHQDHKVKTATTTATSSKKTSSQTGKTGSADNSKASTNVYAGWSQYCSAQEKSCFNYPSDWATKNIGAVDPAGDGIQLTSPSGTVIWFQSAVNGLGGECQPGTPDVFIHKVVLEPHVAGLYMIESGTQGTVNHVGLVDATNGQAPTTGDTGSCISETTFPSKHDSSVDAWLESNGVDNLKLNDLSTVELILESYTYQ